MTKSWSLSWTKTKQEAQLMLTNRATRLKVSQGHQHGTNRYVRYGFLLVCYSNFVPTTHRFWDIRLVLWNKTMRIVSSLQVEYIKNAASQWQFYWKPGLVVTLNRHVSIRYNFLLTFHSNHGSVSYRFRDRRRFESKIAYFPHFRVFYAHALPLELGTGAWSQKNYNDGATRWSKKF